MSHVEAPVTSQPVSLQENGNGTASHVASGVGEQKQVVESYQPVGLKDLTRHDTVNVHQYLDVLEVLLGWERNNRYRVCDPDGNQIFFVYESSDCYARKLLGASRALVMKVTDNDQQDVMSLHRPLRCSSRCCWLCCHLQEMELQSPPGTPIATIREIWRCCGSQYDVFNVKEELMYTIVGDCCYCRCCTAVSFHIYDASSSKQEVATLTKHHGGCKEIINAVNDFTVKYLQPLEVKEKLTIFGSVYLIGLNYFEKHWRC